MIRLMINHAAWTALGGGARDGLAIDCPKPWQGGAPRRDDHVVWLATNVADRLRSQRAKGETYSDTILRLAAEEARI